MHDICAIIPSVLRHILIGILYDLFSLTKAFPIQNIYPLTNDLCRAALS